MTTATLAEATVKYKAKQVTTKHGERINAVFILSNTGEEVTIWANPDNSDLLAVRKDQKVNLININGKWKLATQPTPNPSTVNGNTTTQNHYQPKPATLDNDTKKQIIAYVEQQATLLSYCYEQAYKALNNRFPHSEMEEDESFSLESEAVRSAALTLYISVQKHFNL